MQSSVAAHYRSVIARLCALAPVGSADGDEPPIFLGRVSLAPFVAHARAWCAELTATYTRRAAIRSAVDMVIDPEVSAVEMVDGFETIRQMRVDIEQLRPPPTDFQLRLIWYAIELAAPRIFGERWKTDRVRIQRQMGWHNDFAGIGGVLTGRKEGKSTGLAMAASIMLLNLRAVPIALFSRTLDQAVIILRMAKMLLVVHPHFKQFKAAMSSRIITLSAPGGDTRTITAYSGATDVRFARARVCVCVSAGHLLRRYVMHACARRCAPPPRPVPRAGARPRGAPPRRACAAGR
jgi:hypothetical protein